MNDASGTAAVFKAAVAGEVDGYAAVPTREQFSALDDDPLAGLLYSFGNDQSTYLWSRDDESVKVHASRMLSAPSMYERRMEYRRFMRSLAEWLSAHELNPDGRPIVDLSALSRLDRVQGLERLDRVCGMEAETPIEFSRADYRDVEIPDGATVYADPPYRGTCAAGYSAFNAQRFDAWLAAVDFPVIVSEYTCPDGCVRIASKDVRSIRSASDNSTIKTEGLFVQDRFADMFV